MGRTLPWAFTRCGRAAVGVPRLPHTHNTQHTTHTHTHTHTHGRGAVGVPRLPQAADLRPVRVPGARTRVCVRVRVSVRLAPCACEPRMCVSTCAAGWQRMYTCHAPWAQPATCHDVAAQGPRRCQCCARAGRSDPAVVHQAALLARKLARAAGAPPPGPGADVGPASPGADVGPASPGADVGRVLSAASARADAPRGSRRAAQGSRHAARAGRGRGYRRR